MTAHIQQGASGAETKTTAETVTILYENYRGETAVRRITPIAREWFGSSDWHPEPQWLFTAFDMDKEAFRDFARSGVKAWGQAAVDAALASRADGAGVTAGDTYLDAVQGIINHSVYFDPTTSRYCGVLAAAKEIARLASPAPAAGQAGAVPDSLRALSEAARQGEWKLEELKNHGTSASDQFISYGIDCDGHTILDTLNSGGGLLEQEPADDDIGPFIWDEQARRDLTFIVELVSAYRGGTLLASHPSKQSTVTIPESLREAIARSTALKVDRHEAVVSGQGHKIAESEDADRRAADLALEWVGSVLADPAGQSAGSGAARTPEQQEKIALAQCLERGPAPDSTRTGDAGTEEAIIAALIEFAAAEFRAGMRRNDRGDGSGAKDSAEAADRRQTALSAILGTLAARPAAPEAQGAEISVDVPVMRLSDGCADYYVRIRCGKRACTPYRFKERWKAEYEAAHFSWLFGLRGTKPDLMAYDEASHPNEPAPPASSGQGGR